MSLILNIANTELILLYVTFVISSQEENKSLKTFHAIVILMKGYKSLNLSHTIHMRVGLRILSVWTGLSLILSIGCH